MPLLGVQEDAESDEKPQITDSEEDEPAGAAGEGFEGLRARLQQAEPDEGGANPGGGYRFATCVRTAELCSMDNQGWWWARGLAQTGES